MKQLFLLVSLCYSLAYATDADLAVTARIVETGHMENGREACVVMAEVRNHSAAPITISMMACSWVDSWRIDPKEEFTVPLFWGCDSNYPIEYVFPAGGGYSFRFLVESREARTKLEGKKFKLGFVCIHSVSDYLKVFWEDHKIDAPIVWGLEMTAPNITNRELSVTAERKVLPNQTAQTTPGLRPSVSDL